MQEETNTLGMSLDSTISVQRTFSIIVGMEEVGALRAIPPQLEPYVLRVQMKSIPK